MSKLDTELYQTETVPLGVDCLNFVTNDATWIQVQVLVKGKIKHIPQELVENILKLIKEYDTKKE